MKKFLAGSISVLLLAACNASVSSDTMLDGETMSSDAAVESSTSSADVSSSSSSADAEVEAEVEATVE